MLVYWIVPPSLRWPSGFVECYWQPPFFLEKVATGDNEPHATLRRTLSVGMALSLQAARVTSQQNFTTFGLKTGESPGVLFRVHHTMLPRVQEDQGISWKQGSPEKSSPRLVGWEPPTPHTFCCFSPAAVVDASESISDIIWFVQLNKKLIPNTSLTSQIFQDIFRIV